MYEGRQAGLGALLPASDEGRGARTGLTAKRTETALAKQAVGLPPPVREP